MFKKTILPALLLFIISSVTIYAGKGPGDKIEDFTLKSVDGASYSLSNVKDSKALVIMFWSTECPNVQPYTGRLNEMTKEYSGKGITFWAVNSNSTESYDDVKAHIKAHNYAFPELKDDNNKLADQLGATRTPEVYVINSDNVIVYHGRIDNNRDASKVTSNDLKNALDELLAGKEVTVKTTKTFGCTIKRAD
ncbi:MAG: thioredoxin family protein [Ignavibacteriae bacterium]|nr:MAG: thioredoxin family protein [Ignavibacteriota bacterium]